MPILKELVFSKVKAYL